MRFKSVSGSVGVVGVMLCGSDGLLSVCGPLQSPDVVGGDDVNGVGGGSCVVVGNVLGRDVRGDCELVRDVVVSYLVRGDGDGVEDGDGDGDGVEEGDGDGDGVEDGDCVAVGVFGRDYYRHRVCLTSGGFVRDLSRVGPVLDGSMRGLLCADERGVV
jgi:hypothetical protein